MDNREEEWALCHVEEDSVVDVVDLSLLTDSVGEEEEAAIVVVVGSEDVDEVFHL